MPKPKCLLIKEHRGPDGFENSEFRSRAGLVDMAFGRLPRRRLPYSFAAGPLKADTEEAMRITPEDLYPDPLDIDQTFAAGAIDYALDVEQTGPLHVQGRAEGIEEHRGPKDTVIDIRVRAALEGDLQMLCARCTRPIALHLAEEFDLIFRPSGTDAEQGERSISEAETEIGYYEKDGLSLEDVVREQVLLSLPERTLCREDCRGLCPHCGGNRNDRACECESKQIDSRWAALQGFSAP